jgi:hypothetical protein
VSPLELGEWTGVGARPESGFHLVFFELVPDTAKGVEDVKWRNMAVFRGKGDPVVRRLLRKSCFTVQYFRSTFANTRDPQKLTSHLFS